MGKKKKDYNKILVKADEKERFVQHFNILSISLIIISVIITYSNSFSNSFQFDDVHFILQNRNILDFSRFTEPGFWFDFINRAPAQLTLALNYSIGGYNVFGYHVVNAIIHIFASVLVFVFTGILLNPAAVSNKFTTDNKKIIQMFAALIFAVHPLQTEAVTYVVQRMESLSFVFYLAALIFYYRFRIDKTGKFVKIFLFIIAAVLSVMTKQTAYTLPLTVLLLEVYFIRDSKGLMNRKFVMLLFSGLILALLIGLSADLLPKEYLSDTTRLQYLLAQLKVIPKYALLLFVPYGQNIDHDIKVPESFFEPAVFSGFIFIILLMFASILLYKKGHKLLSFCIMWFFAVISLRSSILPISDLMSEHRLYPAILGFGLAVPVLVIKIVRRAVKEKKMLINVSVTVLILLTSACSYLTVNRNYVWKDELSLWKDSVEKSPDKFRPNYNVAEAYKKAGYPDIALSYYQNAYLINPHSYGLCNNIGNIYSGKNKWDEAEKYYNEALNLKPDYPKALNNLANIYLRKKNFMSAEKLYIKAIDEDPRFVDPILNLGHLYYMTGHYEQAAENYKKVLNLDPENVAAQNNLKIIESRSGTNDK